MSSSTSVIYESFDVYLETVTDMKAKVTAIDAVINYLLAAAAKSAIKGYIDEYQLDDGMTTIKMKYKDVNQIFASIQAMERLRAYYLKMINGTGIYRMVDAKNLLGYF